MAYDPKGKTNKELLEARAKLVTEARNYLSDNEHQWAERHDKQYDAMTAEVASISEALERRNNLTNIEAKGNLSKVGIDDPMINPSRSHSTSFKNSECVFVSSKETYCGIAGLSPKVENGFGEAVRSIVVGPTGKLYNQQLAAIMSEGTNQSGGVTVPIEMSAEVIDLARAQSKVIQAGANTVVMNSKEMTMAKVTSEPVMQVKAEGEMFDNTTMTFGGVRLNAYVIGCYMEASRELIEDAPNFGSLLESELGKSLAKSIDRYAIQGTASGEPTGLTIHPSILETGSIGAITWDDLAAAVSVVRARNHSPSACLLSTTIYDDVRLTKDNQDRWLGPPPILQNIGFADTNNCPNAFAFVGDFTKMIWGVRQNAMIEVSSVGGSLMKSHMVAIKITWRGDFALTDATAFQRLAGITT